MRFLTNFQLVLHQGDVFSWSRKSCMLITRPLLVSTDVIVHSELLIPSYHSQKRASDVKNPSLEAKKSFSYTWTCQVGGIPTIFWVSRSLLSINYHPTFSPGLSCLGLIERNLDFFTQRKKLSEKTEKHSFVSLKQGILAALAANSGAIWGNIGQYSAVYLEDSSISV